MTWQATRFTLDVGISRYEAECRYGRWYVVFYPRFGKRDYQNYHIDRAAPLANFSTAEEAMDAAEAHAASRIDERSVEAS